MKGKSKLQVQREAMTAEGTAHCTKDHNKSWVLKPDTDLFDELWSPSVE